jgi:hypothetical protein
LVAKIFFILFQAEPMCMAISRRVTAAEPHSTPSLALVLVSDMCGSTLAESLHFRSPISPRIGTNGATARHKGASRLNDQETYNVEYSEMCS